MRKGKGDMPVAFKGRARDERATLVVTASGRARGEAWIEVKTAQLF